MSTVTCPTSSWDYARQKRLEKRVEAVVEKLPEPPTQPLILMPDGRYMTPDACLAYFEKERKQAAHYNACWERYQARREEKAREATKTRAKDLAGRLAKMAEEGRSTL